MSAASRRAVWGRLYYAPVIIQPGALPLVRGRGGDTVVDETTDRPGATLVYSTRAAAQEAVASLVERGYHYVGRSMTVAAVIYRPDLIGADFEYADEREADMIRREAGPKR